MKKSIFLVTLLFGGMSFAQTFTNYTIADGLLSDNVLSLDVDASDNVWFGTQFGVSVFDGSAWTSYTTADGIVDNNITAVFVASTGDVWVGTDFGTSVYNGSSWISYTTADGLGNNQIKCISEDTDGDIWFGTNNGASEFDGASWANLGTSDGLPFGGVVSFLMQPGGDIWMGSGLGGVIVYDGAAFTTTLTTAEGLVDNRIRSIIMDDADNRWVATSEGISVFNSSNAHTGNHTMIFTLPAPDTLNPIEDLKMDSQGIIWAGVYVDYLVTEGGVCAYNGSSWVEFHVADGLVGPVVRQLAIDGNDDVWVATSTGVSKISDHTVGTLNVKDMTEFTAYPNPTNDVLNVSYDGASVDSKIQIFSSAMQEVKSVPMNNGVTSISVSDLSAGVYFVRVGKAVSRVIRI
ncbi:MAG: two-component regulator propeller domain-containing protein [Crocinitomicaceae bacterium]|jgi:ligand-binding sensor domain-containing protein|nr:two-component regulator propeller domain-containing protein [Crocinitomicaceae bacterium]MDG2440468.1 two-component regulator propeller domain-containing protein [Crocinitomicaceae bacterium]